MQNSIVDHGWLPKQCGQNILDKSEDSCEQSSWRQLMVWESNICLKSLDKSNEGNKGEGD